MLRLLRLTLILIAVWALAILGARLFGGWIPSSSSFAILFTNPDGSPCERPCILGVRPGQTAYTDAVRLFQAHPFTRTLETVASPGRNGIVFQTPDGKSLTVGISQDTKGIVSLIDLELEPPDPGHFPFKSTLGEAILALGIPDGVQITSDGNGRRISNAFYTYDTANYLEITTQRSQLQHVQMNDSFLWLLLRDEALSRGPDMQNWLGFSTPLRYLYANSHLR